MADDDKDKLKDKDDKGDDKDKKGEITLDQVAAAMRFMYAEQKKFQEGIDAKFAELKSEPKKGDDTPPDDDDKIRAPDKGEDLETLSRADFMARVVDAVKEGLIAPLQKRFADAEDRIEGRAVRDDLDKVSTKYKDFWSWHEEIRKHLDEKPNLSVDEAYHLARAANPEKRQKLDADAGKVEEEKVAEADKAKEQEYGGLFPTSGMSHKTEEMSREEASEAAWKEVVEGTPHEKMLTGS